MLAAVGGLGFVALYKQCPGGNQLRDGCCCRGVFAVDQRCVVSTWKRCGQHWFDSMLNPK
jgi:hypothetical protein